MQVCAPLQPEAQVYQVSHAVPARQASVCEQHEAARHVSHAVCGVNPQLGFSPPPPPPPPPPPDGARGMSPAISGAPCSCEIVSRPWPPRSNRLAIGIAGAKLMPSTSPLPYV